MNNFSANYEKILEVLQLIENKTNFLNQKGAPKLSDIELIAVSLTSEYMSIDSEYQLFRCLPIYLSSRKSVVITININANYFTVEKDFREKIINNIWYIN